jgi:glutamine amidotransferase
VTRTVAVLDYGSGNLRSAQKALARVGAEVTVTNDLDLARRADGLVVPGVGAYAACMDGLVASGADQVVRERATAGRPLLGICVGMQVLFESGDEHGVVTAGIGVLAGEVTRLHAPVLPHMGWNTVTAPPGSPLFAGLEGAFFYFVHSYAARAATRSGDTAGAVTTAEHGDTFAAAVEHGSVAATQFHPEKSGEAGLVLLANWVGSLS